VHTYIYILKLFTRLSTRIRVARNDISSTVIIFRYECYKK